MELSGIWISNGTVSFLSVKMSISKCDILLFANAYIVKSKKHFVLIFLCHFASSIFTLNLFTTGLPSPDV